MKDNKKNSTSPPSSGTAPRSATEQVFFPPEERGEMPQWKRIWRTTTPSGFNREGDTELVAEEGQQPTV